MNLAHLHLLINHLPIIGSVLGSFVLAYGLYTKSSETKSAAYYLLILSTLGAIIAYLTGEPAEETVENIQGISKAMIHQHEDFAGFSLAVLCLTGVLSLMGLYVIFMKKIWSVKLAKLILFLSLISFVLFSITGFYGGQIRHTELNSSSVSDHSEDADRD